MTAVGLVDYVVMALYMALMLGVGFFAMRFNRGASDYFKGGSRVPWLAAALSAFMTGFSAWTFTGAAGLAYRDGIVAILLYLGNAATLGLGYAVFAVRWRRARVVTVMEYLVERFDERTRQIFSWTTVVFQLFTGATMLYGLGLFVAATCGAPIAPTIAVCGGVILGYCVVGGVWAVVLTDFLQALILIPFTAILFVASLARVGGPVALARTLPPALTSLALPSAHGWIYVLAWTVMVSVGYNTGPMAQRYLLVEDERAARRTALLCAALFVAGGLTWFVPPLAMRVLQPDIAAVARGFAHPEEAAYAVAALTMLPSGLVGVLLAAVFSATMSSLSGLFNLHASVISRDIYRTLIRPQADERHLMRVGWAATFGVGLAITAIALAMAARGLSVFDVLVALNTVLALAYGPPALLGLVVERTPRWSGLASFAAGLAAGSYGTFVARPAWSLPRMIAIVVPVSIAVFLAAALFDDARGREARRALFDRLRTPVDVERELAGRPDVTTSVFRFLSVTTGAIGLASLLLVFVTPAGQRMTVVAYAGTTVVLAALLGLVRGRPITPR